MNKEQNNQFRTAALREIKSRFQFLIADQNSWARTLAMNSMLPGDSMYCIKAKTSCTPPAADPYFDLTLFDANGVAFFVTPAHGLVSPSWPGTTSGFTDKGAPCTGFNGNAGAGVDTCPISYKVVWEPVCTGTCKNPLIKVTVRMIYNPSPASHNMSISAGNITGALGWTDDTVAANTGKYDVVLKRSATTINKAFTLAITSVSGVGPPGTPGGACLTAGAYSTRGGAVGPGWYRDPTADVFDLVTVAGPDITIKAGTYSCKMTGLGYAVDNFSIKLVQTSAPVIDPVPGSVASSNAPNGAHLQSAANSSPTISLSADTTFQMRQTCQFADADPTGASYAMGLPTNPYTTASVFASLTCTQTN